MAKVTLKNITKKFGEVVAVNSVNLEIKNREFVVLVGPSGCGKTTTLRMIAGLEKIGEGEIYINDKLVNDLAPKDRNIAMVFQNYALYPHMKVSENMEFGLKMHRVTKKERQQRVQETAEILGIQDLLERKPKQLSGGQRQRVALGRAIIREPDAFLFDEPLSNLDAKLRVQMRTELKKLHERIQSTVIYVTHDQVEAMTMGDRIVVMEDGIVQQIDSAMELYNRPDNLLVAGFIGSPAMNFIPCQLSRENSNIYIDTGDLKILLSDSMVSKAQFSEEKEFVFGIRPEHIYERNPDHKPSINRPTITAMVNVVETLGKEICLDISTAKNTLKALLDPEVEAEPHKNIDLVLNMDKAHLFSKESGEAIF